MQKQESWGQPHHVLLLIILLQGSFMIFMGLQGPAHHQSAAQVAPHHHRPPGKEWKAADSSSQEDPRERLRQRINEAAQQKLDPDALKKHKDSLLKLKGKTKEPKSTSPPRYKSMLQSKQWEVSSTEFPGALHFHFKQEQQEPFFRDENKKTTTELMVQYHAGEKEAVNHMVRKKVKLHSCNYFSEKTQHLRLKAQCFDVGRKGFNGLIVFNSLPFARTFCGRTVEPNKVQHFSRLCDAAYTEPNRILLTESDKQLGVLRKDLRNLPPIVFERQDSYGSIEAVQDCDVPCKFSMDTCMDDNDNDLKGEACLPEISEWTVQGTDWKFRYSMLDPRLAPVSIGISRKGYREHQFYATRSFQSEIPLSTFDWDRYGEMNTPHNDFKKAGQKGICFIHVEPCTGEIRPGTWVSKVQEHFKGKIDYYGPCNFGPSLKRTKTDLDMNKYQDRQTIMHQYMFTIIIGHSQAPDMMTDLIWDALTAGSIPVYHGAPNVLEHVPPNSTIVGGAHSSQQALAEHLNELVETRKKWKELHLWRDEETATSLIQEKYGFLKEKSSSSYCRMCRWAMATKYSLGWDPVKQIIRKPALDRKFCVSPKDELRTPVDEYWMTDLSMERAFGRRVCTKESAQQTFEFDDIALTRVAATHDNGVIDIAITDIKSLRQNLKIVLRLAINGIRNVEGAHIIEPHQVLQHEENPSENIPVMSSIAIQDDKTRATILTNWVTNLSTPNDEGRVDILIRNLKIPGDGSPRTPKREERDDPKQPRLMQDEVLRIRVILEDVNELRDGWTEFNLSPFARLMISDFLDPLMFFSAEAAFA